MITHRTLPVQQGRAQGSMRLAATGEGGKHLPTQHSMLHAPRALPPGSAAAGVGHFKTVAELSGVAAKLLPTLTPSQVAVVVEGLGKAGAKDEALLAGVAAQVRTSEGVALVCVTPPPAAGWRVAGAGTGEPHQGHPAWGMGGAGPSVAHVSPTAGRGAPGGGLNGGTGRRG